MTVIKKELDLRKKANDIQEELKEVIKKYNKVTSIHNIVMVVLTAIIIVLTIFTLFNKTGRYAISEGQEGEYVLDTKTSQLWIRTGSGHSLYLGTNENPAHEVTTINEKKRISEKLYKLIDESIIPKSGEDKKPNDEQKQ